MGFLLGFQPRDGRQIHRIRTMGFESWDFADFGRPKRHATNRRPTIQLLALAKLPRTAAGGDGQGDDHDNDYDGGDGNDFNNSDRGDEGEKEDGDDHEYCHIQCG